MSAALPQRIDFLQLAINLGGNKTTITRMLELFLQSVNESLEKIERAGQDENVLGWLQSVHQLKGAAQNITARRLVMLCLEAEEITSLPNGQSANVVFNLYKEAALLRDVIGQYVAKP